MKVFAANIFERQKALPKPELANHLLMHFLDKFVYRNPKATERKHGGSIMQPVTTVGTATQVIVPGKAGAAQATVINSASFWNLKPEQVAADDVFFHEYYAQSGKPALAVKAARKKAESKNEKVDTDEEEAEEEIWEALVNSKPDIEVGDDLDGSDLNMEDYDDSDDAMELDVAEMESELGSEASAESGGFEGIFGGSDEEDEHASGVETEWDDLDLDDADEEGEATKSEKSKRNKEKRDKRKEMRSLPIFASADDYAHMLAGEQDGLED